MQQKTTFHWNLGLNVNCSLKMYGIGILSKFQRDYGNYSKIQQDNGNWNPHTPPPHGKGKANMATKNSCTKSDLAQKQLLNLDCQKIKTS